MIRNHIQVFVVIIALSQGITLMGAAPAPTKKTKNPIHIEAPMSIVRRGGSELIHWVRRNKISLLDPLMDDFQNDAGTIESNIKKQIAQGNKTFEESYKIILGEEKAKELAEILQQRVKGMTAAAKKKVDEIIAAVTKREIGRNAL